MSHRSLEDALQTVGNPVDLLRNSQIGPGIISLDASANKRFMMGSKYLEARIEVFNLPNHPIFGQPGTQLRTPNFGVITSTRLDSRQIQVGLKYVF